MTPVPKPCPFCGSTAIHVSEDDTGHARWVFCEDCECDGPCIDHRRKHSREEAMEFVVNAWNRRAADTVVAAAFGSEITTSACTCHERDSAFVCKHCYAIGLRGHMQQ